MPREFLFGPLIFTLSGALIGISTAMLYRQEPQERAHVYLEDSLPLCIQGTLAGCVVGLAVMGTYKWINYVRPMIEIVATAVLCASICAPFGWIIGDRQTERVPHDGMVIAASCGFFFGLLVGVDPSFLVPRKTCQSRQQVSQVY
jgi:hypothetical protein